MKKIKVTNPFVEMDGDEMARIMWALIKNNLITPFLDIDIRRFDLSIQNRDATSDAVTMEAAKALKEFGAGAKCATITPDAKRVLEFTLKQMYKSPNGTMRNYLDGTIFREPIIMERVPRLVPNWEHSFIIGRHGYGDQYAAKEMDITGEGEVTITFTPKGGSAPKTLSVHQFKGPGVALAMHNTDESIHGFARSCFNMGKLKKLSVYFSSKNTILKIYDGRFVDIFQEVYDNEFKTDFEALGLTYSHELIDTMVAFALKSKGGFLWACKNYDGDVQSDSAAQGFGSLGLMTSVLISPDGKVALGEAAHGTVTAHYRRWQKIQSEELENDISTNPIASIFAWTGGLRHRALLDDNHELLAFCDKLEAIVKEKVNAGFYTKDLAALVHETNKPERSTWLTTEEFIAVVKEGLEAKLNVLQETA